MKSICSLLILALNLSCSSTQIKQSESTFVDVEVGQGEIQAGSIVKVRWYLRTTDKIASIDTDKFPEVTGGEILEKKIDQRLNFKSFTLNNKKFAKALFLEESIKAATPGKLKISPIELSIKTLSGLERVNSGSAEITITK